MPGRRADLACTTTSRGRSRALREVDGLLHGDRTPARALDLDTRRYFEIGDRDDLDLRREARRLPPAGRRLLRGRALHGVLRDAACRTSTSWCSTGSPRADFDRLLVETVRATYPRARARAFIAHFRGLIGLWVHEHGAAPERLTS